MEVGIDMLRFSTQEWKVKDWHSSGLTMPTLPKVAGKEQTKEPFMLKDSRGHREEGTHAFLNEPSGLFQLSIDNKSCRLQFNPSKPYHAHQLCSDEVTLKNRLNNVLLTLDQEYGIQVDLTESKLKRIDLAKNMHLKNPVSLYSEVFSMLKCKRQKRAGRVNEETFNFGTATTKTFQFYNKGLELKMDNYPSEIVDPLGMKFTRGEIQLQKTGIETSLGIKTFEHFSQTDFQVYRNKYAHLMKDELFRYQTIDSDHFQMSLKYDNDFLIQELIRFRKKHPRNGYMKFVATYGSQQVLEMFGGAKAFREAVLIASGGNRGTADRVKNEVQSAVFDCRLPDNKQLAKMYSELRTKFAS